MKHLYYDARGREVSHMWENGAAPGVNRVWDEANRLTRISNSFATIDYGYDDAGQVRTEGTTVAGSGGQTPAGTGVLKQLNYCRYPSGEVARVTYPNGFVVQHAYTARGQLQTVRDGAQQELVKYTYLKDGKVEFQDYANGVRSAFGYNGRGMISSVHHKRNATGQNLSYREYSRDERDRITAWKRSTDNVLNGMEDGRGDRYGYDDEGQLTTASYRALNPETSPSQAQRTDIFHYDALGNREGSNYLASRGTINFPRRNNGLNQYAGWMPYSPIFYDDPAPPGRGNGVLTENGWITASYNALNQPMGMWSSVYGSTNYLWFGYDPLGRCVKRWVGPDNQAPASVNPATYYYYDGWNLVQEGPNAAVAERTYVHGGRVDEIVASQAGGMWNYHQYDARGHCTLLTDTSGGIREQYEYDAFGYPYTFNAAGTKILASAQWGNRFLFTGREWLRELKVYDYRNRMYQPELGRFLQPDPKHFGAGDYNLYRYCHNDPVNKTDPFGLVDLSYTPRDQTEAIKWENSYNPKGYFTIAGHGDRNGNIVGPDQKVIPIAQIVKDMAAQGYKPGTPIIEVVCESGKGNANSPAGKLAAAVADSTGKTTSVNAPTTDVGAYRPGEKPAPLWEKKADAQQRTGMDKYDTSKPGKFQTYTVDPLKKKD